MKYGKIWNDSGVKTTGGTKLEWAGGTKNLRWNQPGIKGVEYKLEMEQTRREGGWNKKIVPTWSLFQGVGNKNAHYGNL